MEAKLYHRIKRSVRISAVAVILAKGLAAFYDIHYGISRFFAVRNQEIIADSEHVLIELEKEHSSKRTAVAILSWPPPTVDLTIIIATYNMSAYIEQCLQSIISQQTKYSLQILVIDDGSKDQTVDLLTNYSDQITLIRQTNQGCAAARNVGIEQASGKYLMFVDADDRLIAGSIERLLDTAYIESADLVQGGYRTFDERGWIQDFLLEEIVYEQITPQLLDTFPGFACMKILRRELFRQVRFPVGYLFEDTIMAFLIYPQVKRAVAIQDCIYEYRQHRATISRDVSLKTLDTYWIVEELLRQARELNVPEIYYSALLVHQLGPQLYNRTREVPEQYRQAVFLRACQLFAKYPVKKTTDYYEKDIITALKTQNYSLWQLAASRL